MSHSRQSGWFGLPDKTWQAKINENLLGVFADLARAGDIFRGYRPVLGKGSDRRNLELPLPHQVMENRDLLVGS